jgi:DNA polymerase elongation subunit (family B)
MTTICDIETVGLPALTILESLPPWDEQEARNRVPKNYKKPDAIAGWLEEDQANHGKDAIEKAALNPETAMVAIVGFWRNGKVEQLVWDEQPGMPLPMKDNFYFITESELIEHAFMRLNEGAGALSITDHAVLGWNIKGFDLPFLIKRAWILGVTVPRSLFNPFSRYPLPERFIDTMQVWQAGNYKAPYTKLASALKYMGLPEKGDGKEFGKLWETDRSAALAYSATELNLQADLYRKMGLL